MTDPAWVRRSQELEARNAALAAERDEALRVAGELRTFARNRVELILGVSRQTWRPEKERLAQIEGEAEHFLHRPQVAALSSEGQPRETLDVLP